MTTTVDRTENSIDALSILNDDCIYKILELLPLDDLCWCSRTCKRLQALCENIFHRKYEKGATNEVRIEIRTKVGKLRYDSYVKYFHNKSIKNLSIWTWRKNVWNSKHKKESKKAIALRHSHIANFVRQKCDENLHRICIVGSVDLRSFNEIHNFLLNVEIVEFIGRTESSEDEATFLKYCPNLKRLILKDVQNVDAILQGNYQQLTHFYYVNDKWLELNIEMWKRFFRLNNNIQCVALAFEPDFCLPPVNECMKSVTFAALDIQHLLISLSLRRHSVDVDFIFDYLNKLSGRKNFQTLEIEFLGETFTVRETSTVREIAVETDALNSATNRLAKVKQLTKIHLQHFLLSDVIPALRSLIYLRTVVFHDLRIKDWRTYNIDDRISFVDHIQDMDVPHVQEVHFGQMWKWTKRYDDELQTFTMVLVRHWMNLRKILVPSVYTPLTKLNVVQLNRAREKLKNACELTIFTDHPGNATNVEHKLVKLKFTEFEYDCDVIGHPFHYYRRKLYFER